MGVQAAPPASRTRQVDGIRGGFAIIAERTNMPVKVYERILQLFEAEGIKTIFGIPDPNFVHM
ncbi:hypothetical protein, partial [Parafrankia sp. BMG5.11]|uniref:hypothetical protein n=1 Tax=Parafrankia sp. BMG5.11 TaxID=222540 RepID=UPI00103CF758